MISCRQDYQLDIDHAKRRIHQQHMVQWIVDGVVKGITPQQVSDLHPTQLQVALTRLLNLLQQVCFNGPSVTTFNGPSVTTFFYW